MRTIRPAVLWLVALVREVLAVYSRLGGSQFAAAISYRALFSLVPLATFVATVLAELLSSNKLDEQEVVSAIGDQLDLTAQGEARLHELIGSVPSPWSLVGLVTLGIAMWGASGVMNSMQKTLAVVFDAGLSRSFVRGRLVSGLLVLGFLAVILFAVVLSVVENLARKVSQSVDESLGWQPFGFGFLLGVVVPVALTYLIFVLLYRYLPGNRPGWRATLIGAGVAALGFQAVQIGLAWYLSGPADFTQLYGSAGAIFAFLFSVYLSASAFVICAVLTSALDGRHGSDTPDLAERATG